MAGSFKIGIVGAGGIAGAHIGAAKASGGRVEIVAIADPHEHNRNKRAEELGCRGYASAETMFASAKTLGMQGVVICTPPSSRIDIVKAALRVGLHVLSEKPLAHTLGDAKKLAALAKKHKKLVTAVAYCHRFAPAVLEMKRLVESGKIGRLTRWENVFACDLPGHAERWFSEPKTAGGGAFIDMGSHSADLYQFMVGPAVVVGAVNDFNWSGRTETGATVLLKSAKAGGTNIGAGVAGFIASGWAETSRFVVNLVGTGGSLFYDYEKPSELVFKDLVGKAEVMPIEEHGVRFARQLVAFAEAAEGGPRRGLATFEDGVAAAAVVEAEGKLGGKARGGSTGKPKAKRSAAPAKTAKKPAARKTVKR